MLHGPETRKPESADEAVPRKEDLIEAGGDRFYYVTREGRLCCPWCGEFHGYYGDPEASGDYIDENGKECDYPNQAMGRYDKVYHRQCYREKVGEERAEVNHEVGEFA